MPFTTRAPLPRAAAGGEGTGRVHPARQRAEDGCCREAGELLHHGPEVVDVRGHHGGRGPARLRRPVLLALGAPRLHGVRGRGYRLLAGLMARRELERAGRGARLVARVGERGACRRRAVLLAREHGREMVWNEMVRV